MQLGQASIGNILRDSVGRDLVEVPFAHVGLDYRSYIEIDPSLLRPAEVHQLRGDCPKATRELGWRPKTSFEQLVAMMVDADLSLLSSGPLKSKQARFIWELQVFEQTSGDN